MEPLIVIPAIIAIAIVFVVVPVAVTTYLGARKPLEITCPGVGARVMVQVDAKRATLAMFSTARQRVTGCSLWPERAFCERDCV